ncbi:MAG: hypothetical protein HW416_5 [Chloroflexi bacterium]|nr:hypothetical protein [Chloroflexota bacterium]
MAQVVLRIAVVQPPGSTSDEPPVLLTDAQRGWFRRSRIEPIALSLSLRGDVGSHDEILSSIEETFLGAMRYTVTTSLTRALLAAHELLSRENALSLPDQRRFGSAVIAVARPDGIYVARVGHTLVGWFDATGGQVRSDDAGSREDQEQVSELGGPSKPRVTTEFFPLSAGEAVFLLPGVTASTVGANSLATDGRTDVDLEPASRLLGQAPAASAGLVLWWPGGDDDVADERWVGWGSGAAHSPTLTRKPPARAAPSLLTSAVGLETSETEAPPSSPTGQVESDVVAASGSPRAPAHLPLVQMRSVTKRTALLPLVVLAGLLVFAIALLRGAFPSPSAPERSLSDAGRLIQQARAIGDRERSTPLLDEAISILEPQADRDEGARALLADARIERDRVLNIVRVTPAQVQRLALPSSPSPRPVALWKTDERLLVLDLGAQILIRTNADGTGFEAALSPGDPIGGQQIGLFVTGAWSPPRGANTQGQLMIVDSERRLVAIAQNGDVAQRWAPPDSARWERLGPAAATYDDLFLVDTGASQVWRYPARAVGALGSIVLTSDQEPRLSSVVDLATDGNLYLLFGDGQIEKLAPGGAVLPFDGEVPDRPLRNAVAVYAHPDLDRIWVLDPVESRVVEFTVEGRYTRQYVFPAELFRGAVNLDVDARAGELRVLTTQSVLLAQLE